MKPPNANETPKCHAHGFFLIYRTCMRRAPAKPVRACTLRNWCPVSHVTFEAPRHTSHLTVFTLHTALFTLHTPHFTLHSLRTPHSSHFTLHSSHSTLHTSHCALHSPHFTLHSSHSKRHTSQSTLHTALFLPHTSHCTLHLIWALLTLSQLSSSHLISSHMSSKLFMNHFPVLLQRNLHAQCASQACACVLCAKLLQCCCPRTWPARVPGAMQQWSKHFPHTSHCALHTSHLSSFHLVSCLPICATVKTWYWFHGHQFRGYRSSRLPIASHSGSSLLAKKRMDYINISICICISIYSRISRLSISIYIYR